MKTLLMFIGIVASAIIGHSQPLDELHGINASLDTSVRADIGMLDDAALALEGIEPEDKTRNEHQECVINLPATGLEYVTGRGIDLVNEVIGIGSALTGILMCGLSASFFFALVVGIDHARHPTIAGGSTTEA